MVREPLRSLGAYRTVKLLLERGLGARELRETSGWFNDVFGEQHQDLHNILLASRPEHTRRVHQHIGRFFAIARAHKWEKPHTSFALNILSNEGRTPLRAGNPSLFNKYIRAWEYLGPWVKRNVSAGSDRNEYPQLKNGMGTVAAALSESGSRHVNAAHRLLEGKDNEYYPLYLRAVSLTRRLAGRGLVDPRIEYTRPSKLIDECKDILFRLRARPISMLRKQRLTQAASKLLRLKRQARHGD